MSVPASHAHPLLLRLYANRLAVGGILLLLVAVLVWFTDDITAWFAHRPTVANIEGSWIHDAAGGAATAKENSGDDMPANAAKAYQRQRLKTVMAYKGSIVTFKANSYSVTKGTQTIEIPCSYRAVRADLIQALPVNGDDPMSLIIDQDENRLFILQGDLRIPLTRSE